MPIVEAIGLKRTFSGLQAVNGIDFTIASGECYGFLGPNGAGKTTTVRMIQGMIPHSGGKLHVLGRDIGKYAGVVKERIGIVSQDDNLDRDLTVIQNLVTYARYFNIPRHEAMDRARELLAFLQLEEKTNVKIPALSGGMQRRLAIARALINQPRLLILDEPTTGLDPQARLLIWQRLSTLKKDGLTIILTTHYMEEAERLTDRIAIMDHGAILMEGVPAELIKNEIGKDVIEVTAEKGDMEKIIYLLNQAEIRHEQHGETVYVYPENASDILSRIMDQSHNKILHRHATLEDLFLRLAGRSLRE